MKIARGLVPVAVLFISGCVQKETIDGQSVYSLETWVWVATALVSFVSIPIGIYSRTLNKWLRFAIMPLGPLLALLIVPGLALDRTVVSADHFATTHGFWFMPSYYSVRFADLRHLHVTLTERQTRTGRRKDYTLRCLLKSGQTVNIPLGDVMRKAWPEIRARAIDAGIPVAGQEP